MEGRGLVRGALCAISRLLYCRRYKRDYYFSLESHPLDLLCDKQIRDFVYACRWYSYSNTSPHTHNIVQSFRLLEEIFQVCTVKKTIRLFAPFPLVDCNITFKKMAGTEEVLPSSLDANVVEDFGSNFMEVTEEETVNYPSFSRVPF